MARPLLTAVPAPLRPLRPAPSLSLWGHRLSPQLRGTWGASSAPKASSPPIFRSVAAGHHLQPTGQLSAISHDKLGDMGHPGWENLSLLSGRVPPVCATGTELISPMPSELVHFDENDGFLHFKLEIKLFSCAQMKMRNPMNLFGKGAATGESVSQTLLSWVPTCAGGEAWGPGLLRALHPRPLHMLGAGDTRTLLSPPPPASGSLWASSCPGWWLLSTRL